MPTHPMDDNNRLRVDLQPIHQYEHKGVFQAHLDIDIRSVAKYISLYTIVRFLKT